MREAEFKKYLKETKEVLGEHGPDDIRGRMWYLVGWISGGNGVFTGEQIGRLFQLVYPEKE